MYFADFEMDQSDIKKLIQQQGVMLQQQGNMLNLLSHIFQQIQRPECTTFIQQQSSSHLPAASYDDQYSIRTTGYHYSCIPEVTCGHHLQYCTPTYGYFSCLSTASYYDQYSIWTAGCHYSCIPAATYTYHLYYYILTVG